MERILGYEPPRPLYLDRTFRLVISVPASAYMMLYREKENFWLAVFDVPFLIGLIFSYATCVLLLWLINRISFRLDQHNDWRQQTILRIAHQFCWGVACSVLLTFVLVTLFFYLVFGMDIRNTEYLSHDFPLVILLIILGNLYYMAYYLWLVPPQGFVPVNLAKEAMSHAKEAAMANGQEKYRELFLAQTKDGIIPLSQENIAAIYRQDEFVLLKTFDRQTMALEQSINQAFSHLAPLHFFKINQGCIVNYRICQMFKPGKFGKRFLELGAPMNVTQEVTRGRVKDFEQWMDR